jgi:hypothetical protein
MLTLSKALKTGQLREFIAQEEARGVELANLQEFEDLADRLIKDRPPKDQTLRSHGRGGSSGK